MLADPDSFEDNEPKPTSGAIQVMNEIIRTADECFVGGEVSMWYGELSITWRSDNRMLRLAVFSDGREPLLYFQTDHGEALTSGQSIQPANSGALQDKLQWLMARRDCALADG
jgi:hypothetical protein